MLDGLNSYHLDFFHYKPQFEKWRPSGVEPVPHPVVQASEGASEPGGLHDLWAAETGSPHSGVGMLEAPRRE